MVLCNICSGDFKTSSDSIVMCNEKKGAVHLGCCINDCSWNKEPCEHALGTYDKI